MVSLYNLAEDLEEGDEIRFAGVDSDLEQFDQREPQEVTEIRSDEARITVEATQPDGDTTVRFWVEPGGRSKVRSGPEEVDQGEVARAEVPEKGLLFYR